MDTPAFKDKVLKDSDVLKMLVDWLACTYRAAQKLSGILYLHSIDEVRMSKSSLRSLTVLKQLCGENFYSNLTLGTTCWSLVHYSTALAREGELEANSTFWKSMIAKGARLERIPDDVFKAQDFVYDIASHDGVLLKAQRDVVDLNISFSDLEVTQTVKSELELERLRKDQEERRKKLEEAQQEALTRAQYQQRLELEAARLVAEINRRTLYQRNRNRCLRKKPFGTCDNAGCSSRLKQWRYNWRKSCSNARRVHNAEVDIRLLLMSVR